MRINVYNEEVNSDRVELRDKTADGGVTFRGIHLFVFGKNMHTGEDDDSSAIVLWYSDEHTRGLLKNALAKALKIIEENPPI